MFKKILVLGVIMSIVLSLAACKDAPLYNAKFYDDAGKWIHQEFLIENLTRGAYFEGQNTDDDSYPKSVTRLIKSKGEFDAIFAEFPMEIDFDKSMICLYIFTCNYVRPYEISKITIDNQMLKIAVESIKPKGTTGDAVRSWQRCLVVKMDRLEIDTLEFTEKWPDYTNT